MTRNLVVVFGFVKNKDEVGDLLNDLTYRLRKAPRPGGLHAGDPRLRADLLIPYVYDENDSGLTTPNGLVFEVRRSPASAVNSQTGFGPPTHWELALAPSRAIVTDLRFIIDPRDEGSLRREPLLGLAHLVSEGV